MTPRDFCYWLQGLYELHDPQSLNEKQTKIVKDHLNLVFLHSIDPADSDDPNVQAALQAVHDGVDVNELRDNQPPQGGFRPPSPRPRPRPNPDRRIKC